MRHGTEMFLLTESKHHNVVIVPKCRNLLHYNQLDMTLWYDNGKFIWTSPFYLLKHVHSLVVVQFLSSAPHGAKGYNLEQKKKSTIFASNTVQNGVFRINL